MPRTPHPSRSSDVQSHLGYWLRYVSNHVSHAFARKVEAHGVTVAEWVLMRQLLDAGKAAPSHVAERMGMTRGTISKLVSRLAAKGLVASEADATDGRAQTLALTSTGRALVPKLAALADENDAAFFGHLTAVERATLKRMLQGLVGHHRLGKPPVD
jgi:DNA-binding MarR family transcriptional regulator